ncbi:MAG TPA: peptidase, partial [Actinomycetota bacterium]
MTENAYLRTPAIAGDVIAFVTEDDLWTVPADGGVAVRFTAMRGEIARPAFSPDGALLAFSSKEEHHLEVYVAPASGGAPKRLTFLGATSTVVGWTQDGDIVFKTDHGTPFLKETELWAISPRGGEPRRLPHGLASEIAYGPKGKVALGRNTIDPARWKRYRGGTAGHLWV